MNQPDNKKRILGQTKTHGYSPMYQKNFRKILASNSFPIFLKNSRYFMDFNKNYAILAVFSNFWWFRVAGRYYMDIPYF